jgi:hypothetical protein
VGHGVGGRRFDLGFGRDGPGRPPNDAIGRARRGPRRGRPRRDGFSRGFEVSALIAFLAPVVTIAMIRVTREDLAGVQAMPGA